MKKLFLSSLAITCLLSFSSCDTIDDDHDDDEHRHRPVTTTTTTEETTRSISSPYATNPRSTTVETRTTRSAY